MEFDTSVVGGLSSASCATSGEESSTFSILSEQLTRDTPCIVAYIVCLRRKNKINAYSDFQSVLKLTRKVYSEIRCQILSPFSSCCALTVVVRSLFPRHELSER